MESTPEGAPAAPEACGELPVDADAETPRPTDAEPLDVDDSDWAALGDVPYSERLEAAKRESWTVEEASEGLYVAGQDAAGRDMVVFTPLLFLGGRAAEEAKPASSAELRRRVDRMLSFLMLTLDPLVEKDYVLVYCHAELAWFKRDRWNVLRQLHLRLPRKYKKNLRRLLVVHGTFMTRLMFEFTSLFVSPKFFEKLEYADTVEDLGRLTALERARLPPSVLEADAAEREKLKGKSKRSSMSFLEYSRRGSSDSSAPSDTESRRSSHTNRRGSAFFDDVSSGTGGGAESLLRERGAGRRQSMRIGNSLPPQHSPSNSIISTESSVRRMSRLSHRRSISDQGLITDADVDSLTAASPEEPMTRIFGRPLLAQTTVAEDSSIPWIVDACVAFLMRPEAISTEGLFRVSSTETELQEAKEAIEHGRIVAWGTGRGSFVTDAEGRKYAMGTDEIAADAARRKRDRAAGHRIKHFIGKSARKMRNVWRRRVSRPADDSMRISSEAGAEAGLAHRKSISEGGAKAASRGPGRLSGDPHERGSPPVESMASRRGSSDPQAHLRISVDDRGSQCSRESQVTDGIRHAIPEEMPVDLLNAAKLVLEDVHCVARLLKAFLRELPEPLVPYGKYVPLLSATRKFGGSEDSMAEWVDEVRTILYTTNSTHYEVLRYLFMFLVKVAAVEANRMSSESLAIVFAPNILRSRDDSIYAELRDMGLGLHTVMLLVDNASAVFRD